MPYPGSVARSFSYALSGCHDGCVDALRLGFESMASPCALPKRTMGFRAPRRSREALALGRDVVNGGFEAVDCRPPIVTEHSARPTANTDLARALRMLKRDI